jgi:hypothetical protein
MVHAHSIKTREYYGNTSMESEMGFLMAGQTLVRAFPMISRVHADSSAGPVKLYTTRLWELDPYCTLVRTMEPWSWALTSTDVK